jgi:pimeloyl-ACP methyl ester carboxylesterase
MDSNLQYAGAINLVVASFLAPGCDFLKALGIAEFAVVANSFGTRVAQRYAYHYPGRIGGAVSRFLPRSPRHEGPRRYCRPGVLSVNPARRNASAIASPLADPGLLEPARVSPGRRRFSDPAGAISARVVVGRASGA